MTISTWILFIFLALCVLGLGIFVFCLFVDDDKPVVGAICLVVSFALIAGIYGACRWYHTSTATGIRALTDQKAELANGLNRHITIYTADGNVIAEYEGKIDLEDNQGGYVLFDYEGKRYTYYNCFVESIAEIGG
jgi:energy-coupling factor transporter transmembrane protein EcfT